MHCPVPAHWIPWPCACYAALQGLKTALRSHHEACAALEAACAARSRPSGRGRGVDLDPWLTGEACTGRHAGQGLHRTVGSVAAGG